MSLRRSALFLGVYKKTVERKLPFFARRCNKLNKRKDEHFDGLTRTFQKISDVVSSEVRIKSDEHQRYPGIISAYLPKAQYLTFKSERGCVAGQGELKKVQFDPLFVVNHTCAILRANVNRLIRKT
jgi:hypothetical protein